MREFLKELLRDVIESLYSSLREQLRFSASDIWQCFCIVLLACAWMGIAPTLYNEMPAKAPDWMNLTYRLFDGNLLLNIPVCIGLLYIWLKMVKRFVSFNHIRFYWVFLAAFVLLVLNYGEQPYTYAKIAWDIDYRIFLSFLLEVILFLIALKILAFILITICAYLLKLPILKDKEKEKEKRRDERIKKYKEKWKRTPKFSPDYNAYITPSQPVKAYAETIVDRLAFTELREESFAIGITSEWGAGKTTFLNLLKEEIQAGVSNDIVDFNPWMCQSPEQVTRDFFATLRSKLSENHPELSNPIRQYAKHLGSVSLPVLGIASINLNNFTSEKNLLEMKVRLSEQFSKIGNKVVVVIDDLDRLDSSEVFEVLRLIRNTADLSNMIYLVAYDKSYITEILRKQNISDPAAYLEKIFQLEIQLPKVTNEQVGDILSEELDSQLPTMKDIKFTRDQKDLIAEILGTYRRAKRFARLFSLSFDKLERESVHQVVLQEKFLFDLLLMDDKKIYDILWDKPAKILQKTDKGLWVYKEEVAKGNEISIKPTTQQLLTLLWPQSDEEPEQYSIRRVQYSMDYFTLEVQFSETDVEQMVDAADPDELVKGWIGRRKSIRNFADIIKAYCDNKELTISQRRNLIWGILSACYYYESDITTALSNNIFIGNTDFIREWFDKKLKENDYSTGFYSPFPRILEGLSINNDTDLKSIISAVLQGFVDSDKDCSILDVIVPDYFRFSLGEFFNDFGSKTKEIAFACIIDIFSQREPKPTIAEYEEVKEEVIKDDSIWHNALKQAFGDQWIQKLDEIREKCIEPDVKTKIPPKE